MFGDTGKSLNIYIAKSVVRQSASVNSFENIKIAIMLEPLSFHPYRLRHCNRMQQSSISQILHVNKLMKLLSA